MTDTLYQFFQHSKHGNPDTLQMMLSRDEWLDLIVAVMNQMKNGQDDITVELVGRMLTDTEDEA